MKLLKKKHPFTLHASAAGAYAAASASSSETASGGYVPVDSDFRLKDNAADIAIDTNFASQSFWKDVLTRFVHKKSAVVGLILILLITLLAIVGPGMNEYTYSGQNLSQKNLAPRIPILENLGIFDGTETMSTTSGSKVLNGYADNELDDVYYWFGSDIYGRDIWTRTWSGARVSLIIAVAAALIDMVIGMSYGLISGYFGGKTDMIMQRILEISNGIPRLVIVTLLLLILSPGMLTIIFALMLTEWIGMSRIARAEMLKLKEQEFVLASRTLGAGSFFIIFREVLPNIIGPIITQVMFSIPTAIFTEAFLSFVGLGIPVPQCSLGSLISDGFNSLTTHPYQIVPPLVVMALLMLSFNLVADGLREALDPKMKEM
ncbi:MAG: ABC transporter permease [Lachnospiraceae bacterium]|nr:ABC transporter permease [Lachnospiraceae bacterium]